MADDALKFASEAEAVVQRRDELGPLHSVPFTAKDSIDTAKVQTQRGTPIVKRRTPDTDATSVARLKKAGAILRRFRPRRRIQEDWSLQALTGRTNNPWDLDLTPGGLDGSFMLPNVLPGNYLLIAVENAWTIRWNDPTTVMPYLLHAVPIAVRSTEGKAESRGFFETGRKRRGIVLVTPERGANRNL